MPELRATHQIFVLHGLQFMPNLPAISLLLTVEAKTIRASTNRMISNQS